MDHDTDTLLAMLTSLFSTPAPDTSTLLDALANSDGDIECAKSLIISSRLKRRDSGSKGNQKRKRSTERLDTWFRPSSKKQLPSSRDAVTHQDGIKPRSSITRESLLPNEPERLEAAASGPQPSLKLLHVVVPPTEGRDARSRLSSANLLQTHEQTITDFKSKPALTVDATPIFPTPSHSSPSKYQQPAASSSSKPIVDLMSVLRPPPEVTSVPPKCPPLTLSTPALIAQHTPCTMHKAILPPQLACRLFYAMLDQSRGWSRNKWWLFDKLVESPHRTSFYARRQPGADSEESLQEAAQFWYNGRKTDPPSPFLPEMEEACHYVEQVVNEELRKRTRFPLEWAGDGCDGSSWRANVAASNCYEGTKEGVGFHSDQLTYLGPYPTIASISLGTTRVFRLREVVPTSEAALRHARTYNIPLPHNSLLIMHASTQERFKHAIPPQTAIDMFRPPFPPSPDSQSEPAEIEPTNCRINITFRFYRPDFRAQRTPRCKCGVPTVLKPDMKNRADGKDDRYWWTCYAGAQNEGKGCGLWKVMDVREERRGPFIGDVKKSGVI